MPVFIYGGGGADVSVVTAVAADVWTGKVFVDSDGNSVTGTLSVTAGDLRTGAVVHGVTGTYTGLGNATAVQVLAGSTFSTASLSNATGTMPNRDAISHTFTPSASSQSYTVAAGYHSGSGTVTCSAISGLSAGNVRYGATVGDVVGTYTGLGNATAAQVLAGSTFSTASLSNATGTMTNREANQSVQSVGYSEGTLYIRIPAGAYITNGSAGVPEPTVASTTVINALPARTNTAGSGNVAIRATAGTGTVLGYSSAGQDLRLLGPTTTVSGVTWRQVALVGWMSGNYVAG